MGKKKSKPTKKRLDVSSIITNALVDLLIGVILILIGKIMD